jgi:hypothetical protein
MVQHSFPRAGDVGTGLRIEFKEKKMFEILILETLLSELEHKIVRVKYRKANGQVKIYDAVGGKVDGHLYYLGFIKNRNVGNGYRFFSLLVSNILMVECCGKVVFKEKEEVHV